MALEGVQFSETRSQIWTRWFEGPRFDSISLKAVNENNAVFQRLMLVPALFVIAV